MTPSPPRITRKTRLRRSRKQSGRCASSRGSNLPCLSGAVRARPSRNGNKAGGLDLAGHTWRVTDIQRTGSREVYRNDWLILREDDIRRADGSTGIYSVIDKPTYALVIPCDGDRVHLVEQFRYPLGMRRWEFPQGTAPGRGDLDPIELANRELREETGLRAASMELLGMLDVAPGMSSQRGRVFLATELTEGEHDREHEEQDMHSEWFSRAQLEQMIRDGVITDAQSIAAWAMLLLAGR